MTIPDHKPKMCNLSITLGCTLKCKMCFHWQCDERTLTRPTINQWKHFLGSLHGKVNPDFTVVFGGGEPLLFPGELLELISFCTRLRFRTVLATSGYTMTHDYARRLAAAGLDIISITLFSIDDRIHDNIRGITGAHQHAMHALDVLSLQNPKMHIAINSIIMKPSLGELLLLADWVNKDKRFPGINFQAVMKPFHTPPIDNWYQTEPYRDLWPDNITEIEDVIDGLIQRKKGGNRISNPVSQLELFKSFFKQPENFVRSSPCNLVNGNFFNINSNGSVTICPYMEPLGSIMEEDFLTLWGSRRNTMAQEKIKLCQKNCHHLINCWYEEK